MENESKKKLSVHGKPLGRPPGRRDSDLKKTILGIMSKYRIPELVWRDLEAARLDMTPKERFQASVILAELGLKAAPKDFKLEHTGSTFRLVIEGLQNKLLQGETIEVIPTALPQLEARPEPGDAGRLREEFPALSPPPPEPERDTRFANEVKREYARIAERDTSVSVKTGIF